MPNPDTRTETDTREWPVAVNEDGSISYRRWPSEHPKHLEQIAVVPLARAVAAEGERDENFAVVEKLAGFLADPRDERECDCHGEGIDWEGDEWTVCECVLRAIGDLPVGEPMWTCGRDVMETGLGVFTAVNQAAREHFPASDNKRDK